MRNALRCHRYPLDIRGNPPRWLGPELEDCVNFRWAFAPSRRFGKRLLNFPKASPTWHAH